MPRIRLWVPVRASVASGVFVVADDEVALTVAGLGGTAVGVGAGGVAGAVDELEVHAGEQQSVGAVGACVVSGDISEECFECVDCDVAGVCEGVGGVVAEDDTTNINGGGGAVLAAVGVDVEGAAGRQRDVGGVGVVQ